MYFWDELGDSPIPSESGAGSESGFGSPASLGEWDLGVKSLTGTGKDLQTRPCGFGPLGSYIWNHIRCICCCRQHPD